MTDANTPQICIRLTHPAALRELDEPDRLPFNLTIDTALRLDLAPGFKQEKEQAPTTPAPATATPASARRPTRLGLARLRHGCATDRQRCAGAAVASAPWIGNRLSTQQH